MGAEQEVSKSDKENAEMDKVVQDTAKAVISLDMKPKTAVKEVSEAEAAAKGMPAVKKVQAKVDPLKEKVKSDIVAEKKVSMQVAAQKKLLKIAKDKKKKWKSYR